MKNNFLKPFAWVAIVTSIIELIVACVFFTKESAATNLFGWILFIQLSIALPALIIIFSLYKAYKKIGMVDPLPFKLWGIAFLIWLLTLVIMYFKVKSW